MDKSILMTTRMEGPLEMARPEVARPEVALPEVARPEVAPLVGQ